jgi:hypothetical protein
MSVQTEQPLIWLARINTRFWVAVGRVDCGTAAAAELRCFTNFCRISLPLKSRRASMVISLACFLVHLEDTGRLTDVTCSRCPAGAHAEAEGAALPRPCAAWVVFSPGSSRTAKNHSAPKARSGSTSTPGLNRGSSCTGTGGRIFTGHAAGSSLNGPTWRYSVRHGGKRSARSTPLYPLWAGPTTCAT